MLKGLKKFNSSIPDVNTVQTAVNDIYVPLLRNPLLDGILIERVSLSDSAPNLIEHKLGRAVIGWIITDIDGQAQVYRQEYKNINFLQLLTSNSCTVSIYVF